MKRARGAATNKMTIRAHGPSPKRECERLTYVGGGARDRAGSRYSSHERDGEVGNALSKQFNVGIMPVTLMLSATTADSRLSMAASIATVTAAGSSGTMRSGRTCGKETCGNP